MNTNRISLLAGVTLLAAALPGNVLAGMYFRKDAQDAKTAEQMLELVTKDIGNISAALDKSKTDMETKFRELKEQQSKGNITDEERASIKKSAEEYAELVKNTQQLTKALDDLKKEMEAPLLKGGKDLEDTDRKNAIELQRRAYLFKGGAEEDFRADTENLVNMADYRSAARKLAKAGIETRETIIRDFSAGERKAFDAASLDAAFFSPEMLGIEVDCNIECASLLDLYASVTVSRSTFMYPQVVDYGAIGKYSCDAKCDAELGPEGNIQWKNGKTYDFRGVFCFNRKTLQEANYDLLGFMFRAAARSYRINRNRALMVGDGINEPLGWLTADVFTKLKTGGTTFNHVDARRFIASAPVEYGPVVTVMHQNVFAYLAAQVDNNGRFIFGDGDLAYGPDRVNENIRISNCLPDATEGGTLGDAANPFVTGSFLMATGNWPTAYAMVNKKPMFMEQFVGGSTAWCVQYQFGAEDGGFVMCPPAARTLVVGP